jgi:hypothetical protein
MGTAPIEDELMRSQHCLTAPAPGDCVAGLGTITPAPVALPFDILWLTRAAPSPR